MHQLLEKQSAALVSTHFTRPYVASTESCPQARHDVVDVFPALGMSEDGASDATLFLSELFTNAILHHAVGGAEQVHVALQGCVEDGRQWVGIAVTDHGAGTLRPAKDVAPTRADFGHGLEIVRGLGARLTDFRVPGAYTVTAWTPVSDQLRRRVCHCDCSTVHGGAMSACSWLIEERAGWEEAVRKDAPGAHLCAGCLAEPAAAVEATTDESPELAVGASTTTELAAAGR